MKVTNNTFQLRQYYAFANSLQEAIWITNLEGSEVIFVNDSFEKIFAKNKNDFYKDIQNF